MQDVTLADLLHLEPHGPDTYVGLAVRYPWGGRLYGGQVVAQCLRAAALTVDPARPVHSLHAYFIRPGTPTEPIRFEVERLRDGRSFSTRQVVARQSSGAIMNASMSFQAPEDEADVPVGGLPEGLPGPDDPVMANHGWGRLLDRRTPPPELGFSGHWIKLRADLGDDHVLQACGMAFMSDASPSRAARTPHPDLAGDDSDRGKFQGASLDHAMWFHRDTRVDQWHWFEMTSHGLKGGRGIATGDVYTEDGLQVCTVAQQVLLRLLWSND